MQNPLHLPEDKAIKALLSDISLGILVSRASSFADNFAKAAGQAIGADLLFISRVKSVDIPVETYVLYDRNGQLEQYIYPIAGTPCERVIDSMRSLVVNEDVAICFPEDTDLEEFGLHSYIGTPLVDEAGAPIGLIAALWTKAREDLSLEIKALEYFAPILATDMLQQEANARHELAVADASSGAWYIDFEAKTEYYSSAARRIFGRPDAPEKGVHNTILKTLEPEDQRIITEAFNAYRRGEAPFDVNFRVIMPQGQAHWLRMTGSGKRNCDGHMIAIAGDITDISELVEAKRTAEAASAAKSDFLATMSHEIRTPMNGVLSMAGILAKADIPEENKRQAKVIEKSGAAMMVILNDVLDLSKIEAGKLELEIRDFSPRDLVEDVAMLWRGTIEQKGLQFSMQIDKTVPECVRGDETRLRQVLTNLMSNALKFTETGTITLTLETAQDASGPSLRFTISDSGIGIAKSQQKKLFTSFNQADNSIARRYGGTGLGLAISDKIVRLMGGRFDISSEPGKGSSFSFIINAEPATQTNPQKKTDGKDSRPGAETRRKQKQRSILIAEDNEINQSVLQAFLSRLPLTLTFVDNGAKAVEMANAQAFDIILMDVQMPILDGIGATKKIRAGNGPCHNAPIIALTANAMPGDRQRYLNLGMTGYVSKPIDPVALFTALKEAKPLSAAKASEKCDAKSV